MPHTHSGSIQFEFSLFIFFLTVFLISSRQILGTAWNLKGP
jgi:hypothetical protein